MKTQVVIGHSSASLGHIGGRLQAGTRRCRVQSPSPAVRAPLRLVVFPLAVETDAEEERNKRRLREEQEKREHAEYLARKREYEEKARKEAKQQAAADASMMSSKGKEPAVSRADVPPSRGIENEANDILGELNMSGHHSSTPKMASSSSSSWTGAGGAGRASLTVPSPLSPNSYNMTPYADGKDGGGDDDPDKSFEYYIKEKPKDPKKRIPAWARGAALRSAVIQQKTSGIDPEQIFPYNPETPVRVPCAPHSFCFTS